MSILVIGATGFIGPRLIRRLVARGESVVGMDLNPGAAPFGNVPIGAPVVRGDVTQFEDVMRTILDAKPERVINLAYGLGMGEGNPHLAMRLDILGMDNVFEAVPADGRQARGVRQLDRGERSAEPLRRPAGHRGRSAPRHQPVRDAQDLQRVPGAQVHQELRHVDRRRAPGQRHRPRQGARLGRSRADHERRRARQGRCTCPRRG